MPPRYKLDHDYAELYGLAGFDFAGLLVLDVGADHGSTARFFLQQGARAVVCSEPTNSQYFHALAGFARTVPNVHVVDGVFAPSDASALIRHWQPDVIKLDCEGAEAHFLHLGPLASVARLWVVETHTEELLDGFREMLGHWHFEVLRQSGRFATFKAGSAL